MYSAIVCSVCTCIHRHLSRESRIPGAVRFLELFSTLSCIFSIAFFFSCPPPRGGGSSSLSPLFPLTAGAIVLIDLWALSRDDLRAPAPTFSDFGAAPRRGARGGGGRSVLDARLGDCWRWGDAPSYALAVGATFLALCVFCGFFSPRPPLLLLRSLRGGALLCEVLRAARRGAAEAAPAGGGGALLAPLAALASAAAAWALLRNSLAVPAEAAWGAAVAAAAEGVALARAAGYFSPKKRAW
jgi:hypothetical protein